MFSSGKPSWTKRGCKRAVNGNTTWLMREDVHQSAGMAWRSRIECWASNIKISRNTWSTTAHPFLPDPRKYLVIYSLPSGSAYINCINSFLISILWFHHGQKTIWREISSAEPTIAEDSTFNVQRINGTIPINRDMSIFNIHK